MLDVARRLQDIDWPNGSQRGEDFVVVALDADLNDVKRNLTAVLPAAQLEKYRVLRLI